MPLTVVGKARRQRHAHLALPNRHHEAPPNHVQKPGSGSSFVHLTLDRASSLADRVD